MTPVFTYGTLMDSDIMTHVCGAKFAGIQANLSGFRRRKVIDEPYPAITPDPTESVDGYLYFDVHADALARLDRFEGSLYERQVVTLVDAEGRLQTAGAYVLRPENLSQLSDTHWTLEWFQREGKAAFVGEYRGFRDR